MNDPLRKFRSVENPLQEMYPGFILLPQKKSLENSLWINILKKVYAEGAVSQILQIFSNIIPGKHVGTAASRLNFIFL